MSRVNDAADPADNHSDDLEAPEQPTAQTSTAGSGGVWGSLGRKMALYTVARLLLFVALMFLIVGIGQLIDLDVPFLVAGILALVISLPLSMILFTRLRNEINVEISEVDRKRREQREDLHRRMTGEA